MCCSRWARRRREFFAGPNGTIVPAQKPIVVLIDRYSASASEIVAACLQDQGRAVVVGERSWGKGTVQNVIPLENGRSALKLTTASYWRPNGQNIHRGLEDDDDDVWGVRPNEGFENRLTDEAFVELLEIRRARDAVKPLEASENPGDIPAVRDPHIERALEWIATHLAATQP